VQTNWLMQSPLASCTKLKRLIASKRCHNSAISMFGRPAGSLNCPDARCHICP
jgi:hypothetical protein